MLSKICNNCSSPNPQNAVFCGNCGTNIQNCSPTYQRSSPEIRAKEKNRMAVISFVLSVTPIIPLIIFALYLAAVNIWNISVNFDFRIFLMLFLGLALYLGTYTISIPSLILGIMGLKSGRKKFAIMGMIISVFNFSIPFLVSPVNELFLK